MVRGRQQESFDAFEGFEPEAPAARNRLVSAAGWIAGIVVVLTLAYFGTAWYAQDKVATGTTVAGVDIGGLTAEAATAKLDSQLGGRAAQAVLVQVGDQTATLEPDAAGLALNAAATVGSVTGFSLSPADVLPHLVGGGPVEPVLSVDRAALSRTLAELAPTVEVAPVEGAIDFSTGAPAITQPEDGVSLDIEASAALLESEWVDGDQPIALVTTVLEPRIGEAEIARAMDELVNPLLSGSVYIAVGDVNHEITVQDLTSAAAVEPDGTGRLGLIIDGERIIEVIAEETPEHGSPGREASFTFDGGRPTIIPSETGYGLEPAAVAEAVRAAALTDTRSSAVPLTEMEPQFTTADAEALGIVEVVSEFDTPLTADNVRTLNLVAGTAKLNGWLVKPGETFSLLEVLTPISEANGYVTSYVVENGATATATGGGLSQLSTTTYNAAYFAGMDLVEHQPHSRWFSRYPEGREATLWEPDIDMKFRNSTPYGVLVQAWTADGRVHVRMWSTRYFDVETYTSPRRNFTDPGVIYNQSSECIPESGGDSGFTVDVTRTRNLNGAQFDRESWTWSYSGWPRVVCGAAPTG